MVPVEKGGPTIDLDYLIDRLEELLDHSTRVPLTSRVVMDEDEYLLDEREAAEVFEGTPFPICFFGHTHVPGAFVLKEGTVRRLVPEEADSVLPLETGARYLINPGSVGQPRDADPRAAFAIYDEAARRILFRRAEYPVERSRRRILEEGLPAVLGERLLLGI